MEAVLGRRGRVIFDKDLRADVGGGHVVIADNARVLDLAEEAERLVGMRMMKQLRRSQILSEAR